jgi:hypothetical protein
VQVQANQPDRKEEGETEQAQNESHESTATQLISKRQQSKEKRAMVMLKPAGVYKVQGKGIPQLMQPPRVSTAHAPPAVPQKVSMTAFDQPETVHV